MDERLQFVARRLAGEPRAELCREFGISRKTGYKIFDRYQEYGVHGLTDRSRRPYRYANQLPFQVENYILNVRREHPSWGARKIRERLTRRVSGAGSPVFPSPPKAPSMQCSIATAWWSGAVACVGVRKARPYLWDSGPMSSGVRITKASSCSAIASTVIRSRSLITPAVFCSLVKRFLLPEKTTLSRCLSGFFRSGACRPTSAATTAFPSLRLTPCST